MLLSLAQNATTNGGDASRVGAFFSSLISQKNAMFIRKIKAHRQD